MGFSPQGHACLPVGREDTEKRFFNGREAVSTVLTAIKRSSVLSKERSNPVSERLAASVMQSPKE